MHRQFVGMDVMVSWFLVFSLTPVLAVTSKRSLDPNPETSDYRQYQQNYDCGGTIYLHQNEVKTLTSPDYPYSYSANLKCNWEISTANNGLIEFSCPDLQLYPTGTCNAYADYLLVETTRGGIRWYCGSDRTEALVAPYFRITFGTNEQDSAKGFSCTAKTTMLESYPGSSISDYSYPGSFLSASSNPGHSLSGSSYPLPSLTGSSYPGSSSSWSLYPGSSQTGSLYPRPYLSGSSYPGSAFPGAPYPGSSSSAGSFQTSSCRCGLSGYLRGYSNSYAPYQAPNFRSQFSFGNITLDTSGDQELMWGSNHTEEEFPHNDSLTMAVAPQYERQRITGGAVVQLGEFPWLALLEYDPSAGAYGFCGGSLINNKFVLTTAFCLYRRSPTNIRLGEYDRMSTSETNTMNIRPLRSIIHEGYNFQTFENNIGLAELADYVDLVRTYPTIAPVCPPTQVYDSYLGRTAVIAGWGSLSEAALSTGSTVPQKANVDIISSDNCQNLLSSYGVRITQSMLCAGGTGADACNYDGGGPMMLQNQGRYEIIGLISFGVGCGRAGLPGVYTRMDYYMNWIGSMIRDARTCP